MADWISHNRDELIELIRSSIIGRDCGIQGPFGVRRLTYADYTASGRALSFIEDFIRDVVLPLYANTHTESSRTGLQTTKFREAARAIIRQAVGATEQHVVIFCGSGSTAAINRVVNVLELRIPRELDRRYGLSAQIPPAERPVVFVGPYEHHSNELPWRESIADVVVIDQDPCGAIDVNCLERELERHRDRPLKIGTFCAASNVTGILSDVSGISTLLHTYGALSFWDYATAGPYVPIEMGDKGEVGPSDDSTANPLDYRDAVFLSPHKMIGGPGTPGVLVARRELFCNAVPVLPGGGTVSYVNPKEHRYYDDPEHREEGGTPAIVGSIRAGLVFKLKRAVGEDVIRDREERFVARAVESLRADPNIELLGHDSQPRLPILSFLIRRGERWLHHNFVVALLNDLFGIQARGGCSCAGPYGHRLLGIDLERSHRFERVIARGVEGVKPGWARINLNFFISESELEFVLAAISAIARDGWRLLSEYAFDENTGMWRHHRDGGSGLLGLDDVSFDGGCAPALPVEPSDRIGAYLEMADTVFAAARPGAGPTALSAAERARIDELFAGLRWFALPGEEGLDRGDGAIHGSHGSIDRVPSIDGAPEPRVEASGS